MSKRNIKVLSLFLAIVCALSFGLSSAAFYKGGVVKELNPEADEAKLDVKIKTIKKETVEGIFIDINGEEITSYSEKGEAAICNYPEAFSALIGYNSKRMNVSSLRKRYGEYLYQPGKDGTGATIQLTLNAEIQQRCYDLLAGTIGSITIIDAQTGAVICMASRGDPNVGYNVNKIDDVYQKNDDGSVIYYSDYYNSLKNAFYMNRCALASDPPGSTAKIITATSLVENDMEENLNYCDNGKEHGIRNYGNKVYGETDIVKALNNSINTYFAYAGLELGPRKLKKTFNGFMIGVPFDTDFGKINSTYQTSRSLTDFMLASNAFGQGELQVAPLHLAMASAAILNDGTIMTPYMIYRIEDDGKVVYKGKPEVLNEATDKKSANKVKELLHTNADFYGLYGKTFDEDEAYIIAKTGTAQIKRNSEGKQYETHHIYYAMGLEINNKKFGVCIDRENADATGSTLKDTAIEVIQILLNEYKD